MGMIPFAEAVKIRIFNAELAAKLCREEENSLAEKNARFILQVLPSVEEEIEKFLDWDFFNYSQKREINFLLEWVAPQINWCFSPLWWNGEDFWDSYDFQESKEDFWNSEEFLTITEHAFEKAWYEEYLIERDVSLR